MQIFFPLFYLFFVGFCINDVSMPNYFIDTWNNENNHIFPVNMCVRSGVFINFVRYICSDDGNFVYKLIYSKSDGNCNGAYTYQIYNINSSNMEYGLYDFNCIGSTQYILGLSLGFGGECDIFDIQWIVTNTCFHYKNVCNINNIYGSNNSSCNANIPIYSKYTCNNILSQTEFYSDNECSNNNILSYNISNQCTSAYHDDLFYDIFAKMEACYINCTDISNIYSDTNICMVTYPDINIIINNNNNNNNNQSGINSPKTIKHLHIYIIILCTILYILF